MILNFRKSILYILCLVHWVGCTSLIELDRVAQVNEVNVELSERGRAVSEGRNLVLEGKQSLKIALLKIKFLIPEVDYLKNSVVLMDRNIFFDGSTNESILISGKDGKSLQESLLPELYQIYAALEEMKMTLVVTCDTAKYCRPNELRQWIPRNISVVGIGPQNRKKIAKYRPVILLSNSRKTLTSVEKFHFHSDATYWSSRWIKLPKFSSVNLTYNEWSSLIPSVTNF